MPAGAWIAVTALAVLAGGVPMRCRGPVSRRPFRGCRKTVYGFFGYCKQHGFQPGRRLMALLGGQRLIERRICTICGSPTVFRRMQDTGRPYLGCSGFPGCRNPRFLTRY